MLRQTGGLGAASTIALTVALVAAAAADQQVTIGDWQYEQRGGSWYVNADGRSWEVVPDLVTLRFRDDLDPAAIDTVLQRWGLRAVHRGPAQGCVQVSVPADEDAVELLAECWGESIVVDAWANTRAVWAAVPSDSFYARRIAGDPADSCAFRPWWRQWNLRVIDAEAAWEIESGDTSVVIAVIDGGIETDHDDLMGNLWINWDETPGDGIDNDGNGCVDDIYGCNMADSTGSVHNPATHGVSVAGIIAAQTNNAGTGIAGLAGGWYDSLWVAGKRDTGCLVMTASSPGMLSAELMRALEYADTMGADIANMSFTVLEDDNWLAAIDNAAASGMVLVAASGNRSQHPVGFPASDPDVIAVGGVDFRDHDVYYGQKGSALDVVAPSGPCRNYSGHCRSEVRDCLDEYFPDPGVCRNTDPMGWCLHDSLFIWSTGRASSSAPASTYSFFTGTSAAAPQVAALAGLLKSFDASLRATDIRDLIRDSAEDLIGDSDDTQGKDNYYGYGRINAYAALFLTRGGGATTSNLRLCYDVEFDRDVKVSSGDTLRFLPGVTVSFAAGSDAANLGVDSARCELIVEGTLIVDGADSLVTFTSDIDSAGAWYGIRAPADTGAVSLRYCAIENAYKAVSVENPESVALSHIEIDDCVSHGIYLEDCDSAAKVDTCTISDPGQIGIEARECDGLVMRGHEITEATAYGIKCYDASDGTVTGNTVLGASGEEGFIGIYYRRAVGDSVFDISENTVSRCGSRGISVEGGGITATIEDNDVTDDGYDRGTVGIHLYRSKAEVRGNTSEKKETGVMALCGLPSPRQIPDLGRYVSGEYGNNSWLDNSEWYVWTRLSSPDTLWAQMNRHGTKDPDPDKFKPLVEWYPALKDTPEGGGRAPEPPDEPEFEYILTQNWPNPFNPTTTIRYGVAHAGHVRLRIYNASGRLVRTLVDEEHAAGYYDRVWDARDDQGWQLASGVYFARLEIDAVTSEEAADGAVPLVVDVYAVTTAWDPESVSWERDWETPGGDIDAATHMTHVGSAGEATTIGLDLTHIIQGWVDADLTNAGILLVLPAECGHEITAIDQLSSPPRVVVYYTSGDR